MRHNLSHSVTDYWTYSQGSGHKKGDPGRHPQYYSLEEVLGDKCHPNMCHSLSKDPHTAFHLEVALRFGTLAQDRRRVCLHTPFPCCSSRAYLRCSFRSHHMRRP